MPVPISDVRIARSFIGIAAASSEEEQEFDFDLGVQQAIEVFAVLAGLGDVTVTTTTSLVSTFVHQTLHRETQTLFSPNNVPGDANQLDIDSEIMAEFFHNYMTVDSAEGDAAAFASNDSSFIYPAPILSSRNLTHRAETDANISAAVFMHLHYRYVRLTASEAVLLFGRQF